ncbi:MAG: methyltransferase domain-containing protein [Sinimarinibacterium flocculans]|uniref:class I SAM-dependent methyltransferase n=1 Tax=Sinimarinibacterium flocculans TaxID=985250 RepID=UPI003C5E37F2
MDDLAAATPRWGSEGRDRKAMAILQTLISQRGKQLADGVWVDVGCGSGGIAGAISPHVKQIIGIDPEQWHSWDSLAEERPNLSFLTASFDGSRLPLPEETADVVICNQVYEHVAHPAELIRNIHRVLKPSGICYFAGPNLLWPVEPHVHWPFVHWLPRRTAHGFMRALGSERADALDAYSASHWVLMHWFDCAGLSASNLLRARAAAGLRAGGHSWLALLAKAVPDSVYKLLSPLAPGFVFLLAKAEDRGGDAKPGQHQPRTLGGK